MHLLPREVDKLALSQAGALAQRRLARGVRLNAPEATALLASVCMELARDGTHTVAQLMDLGRRLLGRRQVQWGVSVLLGDVQVEATFPDGTKLVTLHSPISLEDGELVWALHGSFLPVPPLSAFASADSPSPLASEEEGGSAAAAGCTEPGQLLPLLHAPPIQLNPGRARLRLRVTSRCDRPIQVGSHYHFLEANSALLFDRRRAYGMRLDIPAGTSVRFEPGETHTVSLVAIAGARVVRGGNGLCDGPVSEGALEGVMARVQARGFGHLEQADAEAGGEGGPSSRMTREHYAHMFGPTVGDRVRLGDTCLVAQVERDLCCVSGAAYGDECKFGGGKTLREGQGQAGGVGPQGALEYVITGALVLDVTGIYKADVGLVGGRIAAIGKAGNPDCMAGVSPGMVVGVNTEAIAGEGMILTVGGLDTHIHYICPQQAEEALASGVTTMYGGGTGPATGTCATTCTPGPEHVRMMLRATDGIPLNFGFSGKGNTSDPAGLEEVLRAGAAGLKLHEDWGTTPAAIDACLRVAVAHDVMVTVHTDTLNESCCLEETVAAVGGRAIHAYHTEGAGGGHAPDIISVVSHPNFIPSSTNPTRPFTVNTLEEHLDMLMVCHHLDGGIKEDIAFAESRIRAETIAAEDVLHDLGAISCMSSDSQAMGRVGEVLTRTWQTAHKMRLQRGPLAEDEAAHPGADNARIKRYLAKYTLNPARAHGMAGLVGSLEVGKLADLVLWRPAFFGSKPEMVLKGGHIAWAQMGDPNASIPSPQPVRGRPMFAALGGAVGPTCFAFVSRAAHEAGVGAAYGLRKATWPVSGCASVTKKDMVFNDATPLVKVDPESYAVTADGELLTCAPARILPLAQRYQLF